MTEGLAAETNVAALDPKLQSVCNSMAFCGTVQIRDFGKEDLTVRIADLCRFLGMAKGRQSGHPVHPDIP